jgi:hypothetical protein
MKTRNQFEATRRVAGLIAIAIIAIGIVACDNGGGATHEHQWGAWTVTTAPTCTTEGEETRECALDATHKETRPIAKTAHQWEWVETTAATPDADGVETETCKTCGQTNGTRPIAKITCKCPEGTTHEPDEKCCEGKDCICPIAEPTVKTFNNKVMFISAFDQSYIYYANIIDARTKAGSKTLEQLDINVVEQLQRVVAAAYTAGTNPVKTRFSNVFDESTGRVVITIDNDATNTSYTTSNKKAVSFNIDYLLAETTTDAVLQAAISAAVTEMNGKPLPTNE